MKSLLLVNMASLFCVREPVVDWVLRLCSIKGKKTAWPVAAVRVGVAVGVFVGVPPGVTVGVGVSGVAVAVGVTAVAVGVAWGETPLFKMYVVAVALCQVTASPALIVIKAGSKPLALITTKLTLAF